MPRLAAPPEPVRTAQGGDPPFLIAIGIGIGLLYLLGYPGKLFAEFAYSQQYSPDPLLQACFFALGFAVLMVAEHRYSSVVMPKMNPSYERYYTVIAILAMPFIGLLYYYLHRISWDFPWFWTNLTTLIVAVIVAVAFNFNDDSLTDKRRNIYYLLIVTALVVSCSICIYGDQFQYLMATKGVPQQAHSQLSNK